MHTRDMRPWSPFRVEDGRCILGTPEEWQKPQEWERDAADCPKCWVCDCTNWPDPQGRCTHCGKVPVPMHVVNVLLPDLWATEGWIHRWVQTTDDGPHLEPVSFGDRFHDDTDLRRDIFSVLDRCSHVTFWLPTRHPERVRERWTACGVEDSGGFTPWGAPIDVPVYYRPNVRLGLFHEWYGDVASTLKQLSNLCGGTFTIHENGEIETLGDDA